MNSPFNIYIKQMNELIIKIGTSQFESILENVIRKVNRMLTVSEAASYLKISKVTLYNWMKMELIISHGIGSRPLYSLYDLNEAIRRRIAVFIIISI